MIAELSQALSSDGPLAGCLDRWQARPGQLRMAEAVARLLAAGGVSMVEAGTGTGKTLAYLVPVVLSGRKVISSTGTRTLQDQLFFKDIPLVRKALGVTFEAALQKGRQNYLCLRRYEAYSDGAGIERIRDRKLGKALTNWARGTTTGDRSEMDDLPDDFPEWRHMSATSEQCLAQRCERYDDCFVYRARRDAMSADIIVVNHHLFFADLSLRMREKGEVLPMADAVIFDEAHQIEQIATLFLGRTVSSGRLADLTGDAEREWRRTFGSGLLPPRVGDALRAATGCGEAVFERFSDGDARRRISPGMVPVETLDAAAESLERLAAVFDDLDRQRPDDALRQIGVRAGSLTADLRAILEESRPDHVAWAERRGASLTLTVAPIELARTFEESLLEDVPAVFFTSATLSSGRAGEGNEGSNFAFVRRRLGLPESAEAFAVESPFDYARQALLYLPRLGAPPDDPAFRELAPREIERIVGVTRGRAFALFTSHRNLDAAARALRGRLDYPLLVQGEGSRSSILERFKDYGDAVLLATASFWEGVDVPGPALSCVIVDKLPFASPGEPIEEARIAYLQEKGENPFMSYQLPRTILSLRQGLGRLIRNEADRGILALLDERVYTRSYGRIVLASLPPCPVTDRLEDVERFLAPVEAR